MKTALITGATSGIGKACAEKLASENFKLILLGRRKELLNTLKIQLTAAYHIECYLITADVRDKNVVAQAINDLPDEWKKIDVLVNNAGLAVGLNPIQEGIYDDWERMLDTNVKGLLYVTREIVPLMIAQGKGHIINIGSIAGKEVYPNGNVYCATKHAVDALNKSMRIDLVKHQIKVTAIHPGAVETEFSIVRFKGDEKRAKAVYDGFQPLTGKDIADAVFYVTTLPEHVNINDLVIMPTAQASATVFHKAT